MTIGKEVVCVKTWADIDSCRMVLWLSLSSFFPVNSMLFAFAHSSSFSSSFCKLSTSSSLLTFCLILVSSSWEASSPLTVVGSHTIGPCARNCIKILLFYSHLAKCLSTDEAISYRPGQGGGQGGRSQPWKGATARRGWTASQMHSAPPWKLQCAPWETHVSLERCKLRQQNLNPKSENQFYVSYLWPKGESARAGWLQSESGPLQSSPLPLTTTEHCSLLGTNGCLKVKVVSKSFFDS